MNGFDGVFVCIGKVEACYHGRQLGTRDSKGVGDRG